MTLATALVIALLCASSALAIILVSSGGGGVTTISKGTTTGCATGCSSSSTTTTTTSEATSYTTTTSTTLSTSRTTSRTSSLTTLTTTTTTTSSCCTSSSKRLGFWVDERDLWSGVGLGWSASQFVANYFEEPPYPSAVLFATAMSPTGAGAPTPTGEAQWLGQVADLARSDGLNVEIMILFFVNLSGQTINGVPDQTSLLTRYMGALGNHSNIYGAEYEVEYFGDTAAEEQAFYGIIKGAGYVDVLNPGEPAFYSGEPVLDYSTYPYFGGVIPAALSPNSTGIGYGETGVPTGSTPNPAWTQSTVQAIINSSPANPFVFLYAGSGGTGQPPYQLWDWSTLQQWIWKDSSYQSDFILSTS